MRAWPHNNSTSVRTRLRAERSNENPKSTKWLHPRSGMKATARVMA